LNDYTESVKSGKGINHGTTNFSMQSLMTTHFEI